MTTVLRASLLMVLAGAATVAQAVQFGWQELNGGGIQYIVQVEPELLDSFHDQGFTSDLPASMHDVRNIRIVVGKEKLPNQNDLRGPEPKTQSDGVAVQPTSTQLPTTNPVDVQSSAIKSSSQKPPALMADFGWQELRGGGIEYIVQVEPELLGSFHDQGFTSDLPPNMRDVRSIRIVVGKEKLPNQNDLRGPEPTTQNQNSVSPPTENQAGALNSAGHQASGNQNPNSTPAGASRNDTAAKSELPADQALPSMPFLGLGRNAANHGNSANGAEKVADPQLKPNEGPSGETADKNYQVVDAKKPSIVNANSQSGSSDADAPKPWWALMGALLALFASLGANVYLVWIHQAARAKYRALVQRTSLGGAAV
jgi:hypothetical protein